MNIVENTKTTNAERRLKYKKNHPDRHRKSTREYQRRTRIAAIDILGGKCIHCGFNDKRALQIDHINGGGRQELLKCSGTQYYKNVIKSFLNKENKYQLLCANCNWIKRVENNEEKKIID